MNSHRSHLVPAIPVPHPLGTGSRPRSSSSPFAETAPTGCPTPTRRRSWSTVRSRSTTGPRCGGCGTSCGPRRSGPNVATCSQSPLDGGSDYAQIAGWLQ